MNITRLRHLQEILRADPNNFDMNRWAHVDVPHDLRPDTTLKRNQLAAWKCRTSACAIGHAAFDPEFYRQGLRLKLLGPHPDSSHYLIPEYQGKVELRAVAAFFDISMTSAQTLFSGDYNRAMEGGRATEPHDVIEAIDFLIEEGYAPGWAC